MMKGYGYRECERCGKKVYCKLTGAAAEARAFMMGDPNRTICAECTTPGEEIRINQLVGRSIGRNHQTVRP
jgi:hypothetical protein